MPGMRFSSSVLFATFELALLLSPLRARAEAPPTPPAPDDVQPTPPSTTAPGPSAQSAAPTPPAPVPVAERVGEPTSPSHGAGNASSNEVNATKPITRRARFGNEGQFVFTDAVQFSIASHPGSPSTFDVVVRPSFHYFVAPDFSLGIGLDFTHETTTRETPTTSYGLGFEAGGNVQLGSLCSVWIRGFLGVYHEHVELPQAPFPSPPEYASEDETGFDVGVYAPLLIHPAEHFFLGIGPLLRYDHLLSEAAVLGGTPNSVEIAADSTIGGWL
jgi:hypothetical protein